MKSFNSLNPLVIFYITLFVLIITLPTFSQEQHWEGDLDPRAPIWREGSVGIGTDGEAREMLEVEGRIRLGTSVTGDFEEGIILWSGSDFQGYNGSEWKSLTGYWDESGGNIFNNTIGNVGIGTTNPQSPLHIEVDNQGVTPVLRLTNLDDYWGGTALDFYTGTEHTGRIYSYWPYLDVGELNFSISGNDILSLKGNNSAYVYGSLSVGTGSTGKLTVVDKVEIGTPIPPLHSSKLYVKGNATVDDLMVGANDDKLEIKFVPGPVWGGNFEVNVPQDNTAQSQVGYGFILKGGEGQNQYPAQGGTIYIQGGYGGAVGTGDGGNVHISGGDSGDGQGGDVYIYGGDGTLDGNIILGGREGSYPIGSVGIGKTPNTNYKLDVLGKIRANEIVVNTTGADFVFDDTYELKTLAEVENYININGHLPDIQPAEELTENGMSVGEMQTKLLQKIEELTLYIIEQDKRIEELELKQ